MKTISDSKLFAYLDKVCRCIQDDKEILTCGPGVERIVHSSDIILAKADGRWKIFEGNLKQ